MQGKYIFGDYSLAFLVADPYGGGTDVLNKWKWKAVNLYEKYSNGSVLAYAPENPELYSFGMDKSNEVYALTNSGIIRFTSQTKCGLTC